MTMHFFSKSNSDNFAINMVSLILNCAYEQLMETVLRLVQGVAVLFSLSQVGYGHRKLLCRERGNHVKRPEVHRLIQDVYCFDFKIK